MSAWPADRAACYGIGCPMHGACARYAAVDGATHPRQSFIGTCAPIGDERPLFIEIEPIGMPAQTAEGQP